jgi:hypothetical protein
MSVIRVVRVMPRNISQATHSMRVIRVIRVLPRNIRVVPKVGHSLHECY